MNESELTQSLRDLDEQLAVPQIRSAIRTEDLETLVSQRRRRRIAKASMAALVLISALVCWPSLRSDQSMVAQNAERVGETDSETEVEKVLRETAALIRETEAYLQTDHISNVTDNMTHVDDASIVSLAVALHYLESGFVEESKSELETIARLFPDSAGAEEAVRQLAGLEQTQRESLDKGV